MSSGQWKVPGLQEICPMKKGLLSLWPKNQTSDLTEKWKITTNEYSSQKSNTFCISVEKYIILSLTTFALRTKVVILKKKID